MESQKLLDVTGNKPLTQFQRAICRIVKNRQINDPNLSENFARCRENAKTGAQIRRGSVAKASRGIRRIRESVVESKVKQGEIFPRSR
jgi:hypothetical protein